MLDVTGVSVTVPKKIQEKEVSMTDNVSGLEVASRQSRSFNQRSTGSFRPYLIGSSSETSVRDRAPET